MASPLRTTGATPATPEAKPRSSREDVLQFLDSLDSYSSSPSRSPHPATDATPTSSRLAKEGATSSTPTHGSTAPPSSTATTVTNAEEAQSVLDFLDEITQRSSTPTAAVKATDPTTRKSTPGGLTKSSSRGNISGVAQARRSGESVRSARGTIGGGGGDSPAGSSGAPGTPTSRNASLPAAASTPQQQQQVAATPAPAETAVGGGWGWSSVWSQASNVVQQASQIAAQAVTVAEEQIHTAASTGGAGVVGGISGGIGNIGGGLGNIGGGLLKALNENEQAKKWSEGVVSYAKNVHLDQLGNDLKSTTLRSLTDLLNAVAPPIAEHEVLEVSLSHDMVGYDGVETLVYNALSKTMEQIEGGTLIVNSGGNDSRPKDGASEDGDDRNLNTIDGLAEGWKLAQVNLEALIKAHYKPVSKTDEDKARDANSLTVPVTTCPIYLRIQPVIAPLPFFPPPTSDSTSAPPPSSLFFLFLLRDPTHSLTHSTVSQGMPAPWLDIPFERNEWVEDIMVNVIRQGVEILGKEYIDMRMHAQEIAISQARSAAEKLLNAPATETQTEAQPAAASATAAKGKSD